MERRRRGRKRDSLRKMEHTLRGRMRLKYVGQSLKDCQLSFHILVTLESL